MNGQRIDWRHHLSLALLGALSLGGTPASIAGEPREGDLWLEELTPERIASVDSMLRIKMPAEERRIPSKPLPRLLDPADRLIFDRAQRLVRKDDHCDDEGLVTRSGEALAAHIRSMPIECLYRLFEDAPGSIRFTAFRAQNMIDVAAVAATLSATYDGTNATNLTELFLFLRTGYYVVFYEPDDLDWDGRTEAIGRAVIAALDAFVDNPHFYDETEEHGAVLREAVTCMDAAEQQARYLPTAKAWMRRWAPRLAESNLGAVIHRYQVLLFRGHQQPSFVNASATDTELVHLLRDFALQDWMLDTNVEYLAANAGLELARFLDYTAAAIYPEVRAGVQRILDRYDAFGDGSSIWIATAGGILHYDHCAAYEICGFEKELEVNTLTVEHSCGDTILIRAQALTGQQLDRACMLLERQQIEFHRRLRTGGEPVPDDYNSGLEIVVFRNSANYETYSGLFFGNDTNNGGIYLEGDPSDPSNTARFIAYVATWLEYNPIWNLEHEQVHYLDGRFNMHGSFDDVRVDSHKTVWWLEGLAEYISNGNANATAIEVGRDRALRLSQVFDTTYADSQTVVYRWSYLAARFLFERHRDQIDVFLNYFREGDYDGYLNYLVDIVATGYDREFNAWLTEVAVTRNQSPALVELPRALTVEEESSSSYEVALATRPAEDVTVEVRAPEDLTVASSVLTFTASNWDEAQTVTVAAGADDNTFDDTLALTHVASGGGYDSVRALVSVRVLDNAPVVSFAGATVSAPEGGTVRLTVRIGEPRDSPTTIGYVIGPDDDPATSDAGGDDHDGRNGSVTIAAGATEATFEIAIHDDSDIDPARETFTVSLDSSVFAEFRPGITRVAVVIEEGVCDRSPAVRDALRNSRDCTAVTDTDLADVEDLNLEGRLDGVLRAGDLSGLTGMADVRLSHNRLTQIPPGLFADLSSLQYLFLDANELAELPNDIFGGLGELGWLFLADNELSALPAGVFVGLTGLLRLQLHDNPGAPFSLTPRWSHADAVDPAAPDMATIVATVVEGAPFDMEMGVSATNGRLSADTVLIPAGARESAPVIVRRIGAGATRVTFDRAPAVPDDRCDTEGGSEGLPCFEGIHTTAGEPLVLFENLPPPVRLPETLRGADAVTINLGKLFGIAPEEAPMYAAESSDPALASVQVEDGLLVVSANEDRAVGVVTITVTATRIDGSTVTRTFTVTIQATAASDASVYLFPSAFETTREGFVRAINRSAEAGEIEILAVDDTGEFRPAVRLAIGAGSTVHFNSNDLEHGNVRKGLSGGIGTGEGEWRLRITSDLDIEVLSYIRTEDGFLTAMHDIVRFDGNRAEVPVFNPGSNTNQRSLLRLVNPDTGTANVTITGVDDNGDSPAGEVQVSIPPGNVRTIWAADLESGADGFQGSLGDGKGKWRLVVTSDRPVVAMNLLESPTGHLTNLSTTPGRMKKKLVLSE